MTHASQCVSLSLFSSNLMDSKMRHFHPVLARYGLLVLICLVRAEALGTCASWESVGQSLALLMGLLLRMLWPKLQAAQCLLAKLMQLQRTGTAVQLSHKANNVTLLTWQVWLCFGSWLTWLVSLSF